jgi:cytochrome P450
MSNEDWQPRRRTLQPIFTKKHVATFARHMSAASEELATEWGDAGSVDLDRDARRLTLRVLSRSVLGIDLGDRAYELAPHLERVLTSVTRRAFNPVRSPFWLRTPARRRDLRARAVIHAALDDAVARTRRGESTDPELIQALLDIRDPETGAGLTDEQIRDELFTFFLAGHDTTATTIAYAAWSLGHRPDLQARVAQEARALGDRTLTADDFAALPFTRQVIHEALRLCPPAAGVGRLATADTIVDGYRVTAGTNILIGIYALHRDPEIWGDDAEEFDPERFSPERSAQRDRWCFLPFGAGPRSCIGDHFAMLEATLALASLFRTIEVESRDDDFPMATPFTLVADGPIPAVVRRRAAS